MKRICVFCGANTGLDPAFRSQAEALGTRLGERNIELVFGAGRVGLMGAIADATLAAGGHAIGVIPTGLVDRELAHPGLDELIVVDSMHERKARMAELSDAFIAMPGGLGTLEELFEALTWMQLGIHAKPVGVLDINSFYSHLVAHLDRAAGEGFLRMEHRQTLLVETDIDALIDRLLGFRAPQVEEWSSNLRQ